MKTTNPPAGSTTGDIIAEIGAPVDVIVVTPEDVARFKDRVGTIIRPALRDGREIYAA